MDNSVHQVWLLAQRNGYTQKLVAFETLLDKRAFDRTGVQTVLEGLHNHPDLPKVLFYGGFIIDWLYGFHQKKTDVRKKKTDAQSYDYAARLCYVLLCFWQERSSHDDQALLALPMLWRSYWLALDQIHQAVENQRQQLPRAANADADLDQCVRRSHEHAWLSGWIGHTVTEQARALRAWQHVCLKDDSVHLRFFEELLCPWERRCTQAIPPDTWWQRLGRRIRQRIAGDDQGFCQFSAWQGLREHEINRLIWDGGQLHVPDLDLAVERRRLRYFMTQWYLPRYDVCKAQRLHVKLAWVERDWLAFVGSPIFGLARLYAAIGAGYMATALQGDTWGILYGIVNPAQSGSLLWFILTVVMGVGTLVYLGHGIMRKIGIGPRRSLNRAFWIWLHGEICALILGTLLLVILAPVIEIQEGQSYAQAVFSRTIALPCLLRGIHLPLSFAMVLLYGQLAVFFGIFIQLLFDEKPTTAPIDAP